jgi:predicted alpha/beta-hydrolase family hydrolase
MVAFAAGIAARGVDVLTFDFLYAAAGRKLPDRGGKLEACWQAALALATAEWPGRTPFVGGKSMGGRIASQLVAAGEVTAAGLVLLGYPLRAPSGKLRAEHLPALARVPTLVVQGDKDEFGGPDELRSYFPATTQIAGVKGRHSLDEKVWPEAIARVAAFVLGGEPATRGGCCS